MGEIAAVIFTYPPHYKCARVAAESLASCGARPFLAIGRGERPPGGGFDTILTDFPRRGNLNGRECVTGILSTLRVLGQYDAVLKVDSDTVVRSTGWLDGIATGGWAVCGCHGRQYPDGTGSRLYGACYAVNPRRIGDLMSALPRSIDAEDIAIGKAARKIGGLRTVMAGTGILRAWSETMGASGLDASQVVSVPRRPVPDGSDVMRDVEMRMRAVVGGWRRAAMRP